MITGTTKQSFVVSAYKDLPNLNRIINRLSDDFNIFIHIDAKSEAISLDDMRNMNARPNVYAERRYVISWGSYKHLLALLGLLRKAVANTEPSGYIHFISGQDIPIRPNAEFSDFFSEAERYIYIWIVEL